jgi:hypothetical protein
MHLSKPVQPTELAAAVLALAGRPHRGRKMSRHGRLTSITNHPGSNSGGPDQGVT